MEKATKSLNIKGYLHVLDKPAVMGILNVTPDSFYGQSRKQSDAEIHQRIIEILDEGGTIVDVGGYSSRPDAADISEAEEMQRLMPALSCLKIHYPDTIVSVDTFRAGIARWAVEEYGVAIINDISGGEIDDRMFDVVAALRVPYILMHMRGTPKTMQQQTGYADMMEEITLYFAEKLRTLQLLGVSDVILDPGFGFGKTLDQNYELMRELSGFAVFERPVLAGVSRKSMIYKLLNNTPDECLNGTTALNTFALLNGADILRVHDVKAAVEAVKIIDKLKNR
ncbi:MAG: dihydropteroate synthase [Tannerella sp.]|jgi:dihydropteroate synthase|nr:dihydropteroate synthase [Tannerella sp.]